MSCSLIARSWSMGSYKGGFSGNYDRPSRRRSCLRCSMSLSQGADEVWEVLFDAVDSEVSEMATRLVGPVPPLVEGFLGGSF